MDRNRVEPGPQALVQAGMAVTPLPWIKPVGLAVLAPAIPGLLLALWVHGRIGSGAAPTSSLDRSHEPGPEQWLTSMEPVYSRAESPPLLKVCVPARNEPQYRKKTIYDLDDEILKPDSVGPWVRERPRDGLPRALMQAKAALEERREVLRQCYRWARYRDRSLQGMVQVEVRVDPFGAWATPRVTPEMPGGIELAACVGRVLAGLREMQVTARNTDGQFGIRFVPSSQRRPRSAPPRPESGPPPAASGPACLLLPAQVPRDRLVAHEPLLEIDDYDTEQARTDDEFDFTQKLDAWELGGQRGPRPVRPPMVEVSGCGLTVRASMGVDGIRQSLRYNMGAYGACYAQAHARHPGLAGRVVIGISVDLGGSLTARVTQSTVQDAELAECLRQAVEEVWFAPWSQDWGKLEITYPFVLSPEPATRADIELCHATITGIEVRALAQLNRGDGRAALRSYSALLRQGREHPHRCQWHTGALAATLALAPWQDERVLTAARELVAALVRPAGTSERDAQLRSVCLDRAAPLLSRLATDIHKRAMRSPTLPLLDLAVQRYQMVLGAGPDLPGADQLRFYLAEALWSAERYCEAAPLYTQVALQTSAEPRTRRREESAEAALLSWRACLDQPWQLLTGLSLRR